MTVPSPKYRCFAKCPNCGDTTWDERYVDSVTDKREVNLEAYLDHRIRETAPRRSNFGAFMICGDYIQKDCQFVLTCKTCGYTIVKDFDKERAEIAREYERKRLEEKAQGAPKDSRARELKTIESI